MTDQPSCSQFERVQLLLADRLSDDERVLLAEHLDECQECQRSIDSSVSGLDFMIETFRVAQSEDTEIEPALATAMSRLAADGPPTVTHVRHTEARQLDREGPSMTASVRHLGPYAIHGEIGRGGMGVVLKAFDTKLNRPVAIKVLTPRVADGKAAREQFLREARAAAVIKNPHVVTVHSVDEIDGEPYIVMEYVSGKSLQRRLKTQPPLEIDEIVRIGLEVAQGLGAAHAQGLVHRDVKPSNILLEGPQQTVKLTDFGLACCLFEGNLTETCEVVGTPLYMSPEQSRGADFDYRSDLFSLGSVLYTLCTGQPAFDASNLYAIARRVSDDIPRPIHELRPDVPSWLVETIERLMAKDPSERFQNAADMISVFQYHVSGHGDLPAISPKRPAKKRRDQRIRGKRPPFSKAALLVCSLSLLIALAAIPPESVANFAMSAIQIVRGDGTLVVEVDDPKVQVLIDEGDIVISGAGSNTVRLRPGKHDVRATKNGVPFLSQEVTITRRGRRLVRVLWNLPDSSQPVGPELAVRRKSAQWVLGLGGHVQIEIFGILANVVDAEALPPREFRADYVFLSRNKNANDGNIQNLTGLASLRRLYLANTSITDAAMQHIAKLTQLEILAIARTGLTDAGTPHLSHLIQLDKLDIAGTRVSDQGLEDICRLTALTRLNLNTTDVTDAGLYNLVRLKHLEVLCLVNTQITDASVETLAKLKSLREIALGRTGVTQDGMTRLKRLLPDCKVLEGDVTIW